MNKFSRISLCGVIIMLTMTTGIYANEKSQSKSVSEVAKIQNVSDAETWMKSYFKKNGISIEVGTSEYVDYLTDILMFENDKVISLQIKSQG